MQTFRIAIYLKILITVNSLMRTDIRDMWIILKSWERGREFSFFHIPISLPECIFALFQ